MQFVGVIFSWKFGAFNTMRDFQNLPTQIKTGFLLVDVCHKNENTKFCNNGMCVMCHGNLLLDAIDVTAVPSQADRR